MGASFQILNEQDYLDLLGVIGKLQESDTQSDLESNVQTHLCPLLQVQTFGCAWMDPDLQTYSPGKVVFFSNEGLFPEGMETGVSTDFTEFTQVQSIGLKTIQTTNNDVPQKPLLQDHSRFPACGNIENHLFMTNPPDYTIRIVLSRVASKATPFTRRELRMAELLQPSLVQAIRYIALRQELSRLSALAEHLADVPTPIVLVAPEEGRVIFSNPFFEKLFHLGRGDPLPEDLIRMLQERDDIYSPTETLVRQDPPPIFYKKKKDVYRVIPNRLDPIEDYEGRCWLLQFKLALDPGSRAAYAMHRARLTGRETEVASLVCDGLTDKQIAERLFISPNTVNNHLKHIFKKMEVRSRVQLVHCLQGKIKGG